jgi:hypothetical protein
VLCLPLAVIVVLCAIKIVSFVPNLMDTKFRMSKPYLLFYLVVWRNNFISKKEIKLCLSNLGHDLCKTCSGRIRQQCPSCLKLSATPASGTLSVEWIKEAKGSKNETTESLSTLTELVGKMVAQCDDLEKVGTIQDIKTTAELLAKTSIPEISGGQVGDSSS